ncbi:MAG TPA: beta-propeller fold lactonase family protein [Gemmatimonadales bacterium]|nr:beta-propeller fold lactonase family protein [Gemmatimonadales bacterium]
MTKHLAVLALAAVGLAACEQTQSVTNPTPPLAAALAARAPDAVQDGPGAVYTLTNQITGNTVVVFRRAADGTLSAVGSVATGGTGTGAGLGSQGAVALSADNRWLFAVNAGSNDVSVLRVDAETPSLASRTPSGGIGPISLSVHGQLLYVLNAGGAGNITGFTVGPDGALAPIAGSTRALSGAAVGPAQVAFSPNGRTLVVTEKTTNRLDVFPVDANGVAGALSSVASAGGTPFGFAFGQRNLLFVSEAAGSASSYSLEHGGTLQVVSGAVLTQQAAPCWAVVTEDGRFGYTANARGGSISGFAVAPSGAITLLDANGATAIVGTGATDLALSLDSRYLYDLVGRNIVALRVEADGHLATTGTIGGLPAGTVGLAAR